MLKQLRLNICLEQEKRKLAALIEQQSGFATRKASIQTRLAEAAEATDAEIEAINTDLTALEKEVGEADVDNKIKNVEGEITRIEAELAEINGEDTTENGDPAPTSGTKGKEARKMKIAGNAISMRERLEPLVQRAEVKTWLEQLRAYGKGEARAITGGDLNIPEYVLEPLREVVEKNSKLIKYLNFKRLKGKARQPIVGTIPEAVWEEMASALNELSFGFNMAEVDGYKISGFIPVPNSLLEDSDINLLIEVVDMLGKSLAYGLDKSIIYGGGVKMPLGIVTRLSNATAPRDLGTNAPTYTDLSSSNISYLSSASLSATAFFAEVAAGLAKARSKYAGGGKFWAMSETTWITLQTKLISINATGAIATGASMVMPIVGGAVELLDFMPDNVIAGGYGSLYLLSERQGGTISKSEHAQFVQDNTVFKGVARYDGIPVIGEGFAMFTLATSTGTTELTFAEDRANPTDAYLTALTVKNGSTDVAISPTFDKNKTAYTASVANGVSSVTVTATARTYGAVKSIKVGTTAATAGACSLSVGENTITVVAKYGTSERTYTVVVTRAAS